ncbi:efflux transporter outer membrane subunit [Massilia sp. YMA4]|uniref:efflux transporter outer membrane subunit n=1 Tax=Massilia sp. YMA4 TaxID=1593482 RepID=UPI001D0C2682|nr:efflux transporter outer membrane subunit [Massilia sp. YMA4]
MRSLRLSLTAMAVALALAGCADMGNVQPQAHALRPADLTAGKAIAGAVDPAATWPRDEWWKAFGDPQLDRLMAAALADNPTLKVAQARVRQAEALAGVANAATLPKVDASASSTRELFASHGSAPAAIAGSWQWYNAATLTGSYDLDVWGRQHDLLAAAVDETHVAAAEAQMARLALQTAIVRDYIQLWYRHALQDSVADSLAQRQRILEIARKRHQAGLTGELDVAAIETTLPAGRRQHEEIGASIAVLRHQLAALVGKGPGDGDTIVRPAPALLENGTRLGLPSALPAELVGRRPDIAAQRWRVEAAAREIDAARAAFYPNINIAAFAGLQSFGFSRLLESSARTMGVTPALTLPIFEGGRLRGQLGARTAAYDAAVEQYNATVVQALADVANVVAKIHSAQQQERLAARALASARRAEMLAEQAYKAGMTDYLGVLQAKLTLLAEQDQLLRVTGERLDNYASLMTALGGGMEIHFP